MLTERAQAPEHEVLLVAAGTGAGGPGALQAALSRVTDWDYLLSAASLHGVLPLLYRRLADGCPEAVPPDFLHRLRSRYRDHARRNLRMTTGLLRVLKLLEDHNICPLPFKGPVLAELAYGDLSLRQFGDLDILVPQQDAGRAKDLLAGWGYALKFPLSARQERAHLRHAFEFGLRHPQLPVVEIHWRFGEIFLSRAPEPEEVFRRRVQVSLLGRRVSSPAPDDLLLVLCLHGLSHLWFTLSMVSDVAHLLHAQGPWDWAGLLSRATALRMRRILLLGVSLAHELLAEPVPPEVLSPAQADPAVPALCREVQEKLFARGGAGLGFLERVCFHLRARERLRDKITYLWISLAQPTSEDWRWLPMPDYLYWLYYVLRPWRLLWQRVILPSLGRRNLP
jgi:hypothetical protein